MSAPGQTDDMTTVAQLRALVGTPDTAATVAKARDRRHDTEQPR